MTFDEWWEGGNIGPCYEMMKMAWNAAVKQEREACALICDNRHVQHTKMFGTTEDFTSGPKECAEAIRARSES